MPDLRTDAQLVTAYTGGDRSALAGIYDRFSGGLYDTAAAMLRDRHEAADAMQDVFLIAAERMGQLREPERSERGGAVAGGDFAPNAPKVLYRIIHLEFHR